MAMVTLSHGDHMTSHDLQMREIELCPSCYKLTVLQPEEWFCTPCVCLIISITIYGDLCVTINRAPHTVWSWPRSEVILSGQPSSSARPLTSVMSGSLASMTGKPHPHTTPTVSLMRSWPQVSGSQVVYPGANWPSSHTLLQDTVLEHCHV